MKRLLIKEFVIYLIIFLLLTLGMHYKEWFSHPFEHISSLPTSQFGIYFSVSEFILSF